MVNLSPHPVWPQRHKEGVGAGAEDTGRNAVGPLLPALAPFLGSCVAVSWSPRPRPFASLHTPGLGLLTAVASLGASARPLLWLCRGLLGHDPSPQGNQAAAPHSQQETGARRSGADGWGGTELAAEPACPRRTTRPGGVRAFLARGGGGQTLGVPAFAGPPVCFTAHSSVVPDPSGEDPVTRRTLGFSFLTLQRRAALWRVAVETAGSTHRETEACRR